MERRLGLGRLAHRTGTRLLHLPDPHGTPLDGRVPRVVTCHDLIPLLFHREYLAPVPGARRIQWLRDQARYRFAVRVIAASVSTKSDLAEHVGVAPDRIDVVHHGVDHERFHPRPGPDEDAAVARLLGFSPPFLLYVGAADARKNLPVLIAAYARSGVAAELPLVLVGAMSAAARARIDAAVDAAQVRGRVRLCGFVDDERIVALYRQCLAHVFPSTYEGFGLPVLEAMACGAPTITGRASSLGEVAGDAALSLERIAVEPLAAAIARLGSDGPLRAALRQRGIAHASRFTWERCAAETTQCYVRALADLSP